MTNQTTARRLIKAEQLRERAGGISKMTEWRWKRQGLLPPAVTICRRNYYDEAAADAAIEALVSRDGAIGGSR